MKVTKLLWLFLPCLVTFSAQANKVSLSEIKQTALNKQLYANPIWQTLLHFHHNEYFVTDPHFLLSANDPNTKTELLLTLDAFSQPIETGTPHPICQFPARYLWLKNQLDWPQDLFPQPICKEYQRYQALAPADKIQLIFASENLTSPSSMMGHAFLKISGTNPKGRKVEHAISYFTVIDTFNLASLVYRSLIEGMEGKLSLLPYQTHIQRYQQQENRNIWEYELNLDAVSKALIHAHIWELKDRYSTYYFTKYNCATFTHFLLALGNPDILKTDHLWVTPSDVIKDAYKYQLIQSSKLHPSDKWMISMLLEQTEDTGSFETIRDSILTGTPYAFSANVTDQPFQLAFYHAYNNYAWQNGYLTQTQYLSNFKHYQQSKTNDSVNFDLSDYKHPQKTPNDSQLSFNVLNKNRASMAGIRFLPAAHLLTDDNRQYFTENELTMADIQLNVHLEKPGIELDHLTFYGINILNPWDRYTKGWSGKWKLNIEDQYNDQLLAEKVLNLDGALGITLRIHRDIDLFAMLGAGLAGNTEEQYGYVAPEIGFVIREIADMKTYASAKLFKNQLNNKKETVALTLNQSWFFSQEYALQFKLTQHQTLENKQSPLLNWQLELVHYL